MRSGIAYSVNSTFHFSRSLGIKKQVNAFWSYLIYDQTLSLDSVLGSSMKCMQTLEIPFYKWYFYILR